MPICARARNCSVGSDTKSNDSSAACGVKDGPGGPLLKLRAQDCWHPWRNFNKVIWDERRNLI